MGILTSILGQWRMGLYGLIAAGLLIAGWTVNGWRNDANKLVAANAAVRDAQAKMVSWQRKAAQADRDRVSAAVDLAEAEERIRSNSTQAKVIVRRVVQSDPRCDLEPSIVRVLAAARRGEAVPATADDAAHAGGTAATPPRQ